jgi:hypothetical protein
VCIDIDLNVGDIGHPTSTSVIPISETNMSEFGGVVAQWGGVVAQWGGVVAQLRGVVAQW